MRTVNHASPQLSVTLAPTTLAQLAALVGGELHGDGATKICGAAPLDDAHVGVITLVDQPERLKQFLASGAAAVVLPEGMAPPEGVAAILVADLHAAFITIVTHFRPLPAERKPGVHPTACVAASATLGANVWLGPGVVVGEHATVGAGCTLHPNVVVLDYCHVGAGATLFPNVTLYEHTVIGDDTIIHSGATIGSYGFGYRTTGGRHERAAQLGWVEIGSDVEIGANVAIDRGVYGPTRIGAGTKIDNLVQIAHNCQIGKHNLICSQVGIAGSTSTGEYVVMAGQVGVRDHVKIGRGAMIGAMAGIVNDVPAGASMLGAPAKPEREQKLQFAAMAKLPEMRKEFKQLRAEVAELKRLLAISTESRAA
jgi:UDP-3-O-[3-hydroxymyristoyl] glucosamine N-acyltransferase